MTKTDFIKFNVSPEFKIQAEMKAKEYGMTLSELGRMLFGSFVTGTSKPSLDISPKFLKMAEEAKEDYEKGAGVTFDKVEDAIDYLHKL